MISFLSIDFEQASGTHAAGNAHRDDRVLHAAPAALDEDVSRETRARHTERMADRDRAAIDVEPLGRNAEALLAVDRLRCKCFVELTNALISAPASSTASASGSFSAAWMAPGSWRRM
ncbi:hypothetical protein PTKU46_72640 [Paraburkholderia terrae]